jgi:hypothetical protein
MYVVVRVQDVLGGFPKQTAIAKARNNTKYSGRARCIIRRIRTPDCAICGYFVHDGGSLLFNTADEARVELERLSELGEYVFIGEIVGTVTPGDPVYEEAADLERYP